MRFSVAAASVFAASALAMASPDYTVTEVDWVTVTSCPPSYSTNCPLYSYKPSPMVTVKTSTTPCPEEAAYTTTTTPYVAPVPVYTTTTTPYVAPAPMTTPCNSTTPTAPVYVAPVPVYSTSWAYVCPHPEICHATSTVVPVAPTYAPAPTYGSSNVTTPAAPVYTGAASSVNIGAGAVLGLVSLAAFFLA